MATEHSTLTGANLHEPKGVASATNGQIYLANGSGSGVWTDSNTIASASEYAMIYTAGGTTASAAITTATLLNMFASDGSANVAVADSANDRITLTTAGLYFISFNISYTGSASNAVWQFHARLDAVESVLGAHRKIGTGSDTGSCGFSGILTATAGQQLTVYAESDSSSTITPSDMQLTAQLLKAS